jgi:hypothetical protein
MSDIFLEKTIKEFFNVDINSVEVDVNESVIVRRQTPKMKRKKRIGKKRAHRGTNWSSVKPKKGFKRVKVGNKYIKKRMSAVEKKIKKRVGTAVGRKSQLFR